MANMVKWNKSNAMKLSWAVRNFNKTIQKIETEENKMYLPEKIKYEDLKADIFTTQNLKQTINNLKRFSNEKEQRIVKVNEEEFLTNWEFKELKKEKRRAERRMTTDLIEIQNTNKSQRAGFTTADERQLKRSIESLENLYKFFKSDFKRIKDRIHNIGSVDYKMRRANIFRENYYTALKSIKHFENYSILKKKLDSITNPIEFFEYTQKNEILKDIFLWYPDNKSKNSYKLVGFVSNEDAFDFALESLGLIK